MLEEKGEEEREVVKVERTLIRWRKKSEDIE